MLRPGRWILGVFCALFAVAGCSSTGGQLGTLQTQNRSLLEQNKTQLGEIENLRSHARRLEDKLIESERQLALRERGGQAEQQPFASAKEDAAALKR